MKQTNEYKKSGKNSRERGINRFFENDLHINRNSISRFFPFLLFLSLLVTLYIANKYYSEKSYLEETKIKQEIKDLRAESLTTKAQLINKTKQSDVELRAKEIGLEELLNPPKIISIKEGEYKE